MRDNKIEYVIDIVDRWSKPMHSFQKDVDRLNRSKVQNPMRDVPKSLSQLRRDLSRYKRLQEEAFRTDHIKKYGRMIETTERKIHGLEKKAQACKTKTQGLFGKLRSNFGITPGFMAAGGVIAGLETLRRSLMDTINAAAKFEKYGVTLKTMLGSQGAARQRMDEYTEIAAKTPFQLQQVVEAGNQLQAIGRYSKDTLKNLGDLAAASGKPIEQVLNAYAKLSTGQKGEAVNMFRDLLISSEDWAEATGKGIKKNGELVADTEKMLKSLPKILEKKGFLGMMDEQAKTTEGQMSNLADSFDLLKVAVGQKMQPAFNSFLSYTSDIVENMRDWVEVPTAEKIAKEKAELNALVGVITDANTGEETRASLIQELQQQYPEFLGNIDMETLKNEELRKKLAQVNKQYEDKMRLASMKDRVSEVQEQYQEKLQELEDVKMAIESRKMMKNMAEQVFSYADTGIAAHSKYAESFEGLSISTLKKLADDVRDAVKDYYDPNTKTDLTGEQVQDMNEWLGNFDLYKRYENESFFGMRTAHANVKQLRAEAEQSREILMRYKQNLAAFEGDMERTERKQLLEKAKKVEVKDEDIFNELFGNKKRAQEFRQLRKKAQKSFDKVNMDEWQRMADFLAGKLKYEDKNVDNDPDNVDNDPYDNPPKGTDMQKAVNTITGGGKQIKNITIKMDNLLGENTNIFREDETPEDAREMVEEMQAALQEVLNNVNAT